MPAPSNGRGLFRRRHHLVRLALLTLGWTMLVFGLVGGLIPVFQGWPFGVAGAVILYVESRWFQRTVRRWRQRHPRLERVWLKLRSWRHGRKKPRPNGTRPDPPADAPG
ncbi:MAG: hypothetical protein HY900_06665 [Deltaproteobacteria bacterium]|nr:hypothetical protein [Deltaproteobacteria bacterium]